MLIVVPGSNPLSAYVAVKAFPTQPVTIVTSQEEYIHAQRLAACLAKEGRRVERITQLSENDAEGFVQKQEGEELIVHCGELTPLALSLVHAMRGTGKVTMCNDRDLVVMSRTRGYIRMKDKLQIETLLALRGMKYELSRSVDDPNLAMQIVDLHSSEERAIEWLKWVYRQEAPPEKIVDIIPQLSKKDKNWLRHGWLKEHLFHSLKDIDAIGDLAHSVRFSMEGVGIDVAATCNYCLVAFACVTQVNEESCIDRANAVYQAARRLAGNFARVALLCPRRNVSFIEYKLAHMIGTSAVRAFGLSNLQSEVKAWVESILYNDTHRYDVEDIREERERELIMRGY